MITFRNLEIGCIFRLTNFVIFPDDGGDEVEREEDGVDGVFNGVQRVQQRCQRLQQSIQRV